MAVSKKGLLACTPTADRETLKPNRRTAASFPRHLAAFACAIVHLCALNTD